jgi:molecular chaperone HtpG
MAKQTQSFNAEIKQLLDLMIHSLYSHKEIFLRELVSNASDALDKVKFQSLTQDNLMNPGTELQIRLEPNKEMRTLRLIDNGIGMSPEEVVEYIGTIARSGTKKFAQMNQELKERPELIGQFGVGFYSSFMVADKVTLHTQKAGTHMGTLWESQGDGTYSIDEVPRPEGHGTSITLHLKTFAADEEVEDFADPSTLRSLVKKYSDFIAYPIRMPVEKDGKTEDETINSQKALWLKSPSEITKEEYKEFYHHLSHDWNDPLKTIHYKAEGTMEFNALLYLPTQKPWNFSLRDMEYGLSLYIKRVFIMADCKDLLPSYLRFVKGLVDSSDLSLNVSREILQQDRQVTQIRKNVVNKVLSSLKEMLNKERGLYETFWNEFGATLKEGFPGDLPNKEKLQDLALFKSTAGDAWTTLDEYVARMKPEQKEIYFITGDDLGKMAESPYLEALKVKNFEVVLMADPIDEWVTDNLREFKGKKLQSVMKEDLNLDSEEEKKTKEDEKKSHLERFKPLMEAMQATLKDSVKEVQISDRLTETPAVLVGSSHDPSAHMQKILSQMGQDMPAGGPKRILEINPKHPVLEKMIGLPADQQKLWTEVLYSQALLNEGSNIPDPKKFSKQLAELMLR